MLFLKEKITDELDGCDVKTVLKKSMGVSSSLISKVKLRDNGILLNGARVFTNATVKSGDELWFDIADSPSVKTVKKIHYPLDIVFEDEHLLIINKPAGMVAYASEKAEGPCTLQNALAYYFDDEHLNLHVVNRLDRGTTGLMTVAKNPYCHECLRQKLHTSEFEREYLAVTVGTPSPEKGMIDKPIARDEGSLIKRVISEDGAKALTLYETVKQSPPFALVRLKLKTGRTHQIRLHMSYMGCPLAGDFLYGSENKDLISRPALHSCTLRFTHPVTGKLMEFHSTPPEDMLSLIK